MDNIKPYITSAKSIPNASPIDTLGSVIKKARSGGDGLFVFDYSKKNLFLGIVSPSYCLFKHRFPSNTKLSHCVVVPPFIEPTVSIFDVASHMLSLGIYTLPVFDKKQKIIGVITGRSIIKAIQDEKMIQKDIKQKLKINIPITVRGSVTVGEVYTRLRKEKGSRIVIVNPKGALEGILTRRDLQDAFMSPSTGLRSGKNKGIGVRSTNFNIDEITRFDFPVSEFYRTDVVTVAKGAGIFEIIKLMLDRSVNSVILVDRNNHPVGIISVRSILSALVEAMPKQQIPIEISDRHNLISDGEKSAIFAILSKFGDKQMRISTIKSLELFVEAAKNPKGKIISYHVSLFEKLANGEKYGTQVEDKRLMFCVKEALRKIKSQQS